MTRRVYFLAHGGMVQGVGFRCFARKRAIKYQVTGWVRNAPNNKVEGEAQGSDDAIKTFLKEVDNGPRSAKVVKLDTEDRDAIEGETGFEVRS